MPWWVDHLEASMGSKTMWRELGLERGPMRKITVRVDEEFYQVIKKNRMNITRLVNHAIEDYLRAHDALRGRRENGPGKGEIV